MLLRLKGNWLLCLCFTAFVQSCVTESSEQETNETALKRNLSNPKKKAEKDVDKRDVNNVKVNMDWDEQNAIEMPKIQNANHRSKTQNRNRQQQQRPGKTNQKRTNSNGGSQNNPNHHHNHHHQLPSDCNKPGRFYHRVIIRTKPSHNLPPVNHNPYYYN